jgi:hypothetical protein
VLQQLTETSEVWLGVESSESVAASRQFQFTMRKLTSSMWISNEKAVKDATRRPTRRASDIFVDDGASITYHAIDGEHQLLVRNMGVLDAVIGLMSDALDVFKSRRSSKRHTPNFVQETRRTFAHCYNFLRAFVFENAKNAKSVSAHMDLLLRCIQEQLCAGNLLGDLIRYDPLASRELREPFFLSVMEQVERKGSVPGLIAPVIAAMQCKEVGLQMQRSLLHMVSSCSLAVRIFQDSVKIHASIHDMISVRGSMEGLLLAFRDLGMSMLGTPGTSPILSILTSTNPDTAVRPGSFIDVRTSVLPQRHRLTVGLSTEPGVAVVSDTCDELEYLRADVEPQPLAFHMYMLHALSTCAALTGSGLEVCCGRLALAGMCSA